MIPKTKQKLLQELKDDGENPKLWYFLALCQLKDQDYVAAKDSLERSLKLKPNVFEARFNLAKLCEAHFSLEEAMEHYRKLVFERGTKKEVLISMARVFRRQENLKASLECYEKVLEKGVNNKLKDPKFTAGIYSHYLETLLAMGRKKEFWEKLHVFSSLLEPAIARYYPTDLSLLLISQGHFMEGFDLYRGRFEKRKRLLGMCSEDVEEIDWGSLSEKNIHITGEQGIGDQIFFLSFAQELKKQGAAIRLSCHPKIAGMLKMREFFDEICIQGEPVYEHFDLSLSLGDLPFLVFKKNPQFVPEPVFIKPKREKGDHFSKILSKKGPPPYIGITWRAGSYVQEKGAFEKQLPLESFMSVFDTIPGTLVIVQRYPSQEDMQTLRTMCKQEIVDLSAANEDLEAMLALLSSLDEYVGVSNTNTYLRLSSGKACRVFIHLPNDWKWNCEKGKPRWFKQCCVYRQSADYTWTDAFTGLKNDLEAIHGRR